MWPQEAAHSQDAAGLTVDSREARLLLLCSELCLANRIFKFLNCRPVWSLQDYIIIMDTHDAHLTFPSISFGFCFVPLAHPTSWNEEGHSMTVQKGCRDFKLPWKVTFFFLCFTFLLVFSVHTWLFPMLCYGALCLSLMYQNTVTVFVMYIVSRIKWNVGSGCLVVVFNSLVLVVSLNLKCMMLCLN